MRWLRALVVIALAGCTYATYDPIVNSEPKEIAMPTTECRVVLVGGTWALKRTGDEAWWRPTSPFADTLRKHGIATVSRRAFVWTTDLEGVWPSRRRRSWSVGGENLATYLQVHTREGERVCAIAHSHGGNVLAYAARFGAKFDTVITVATPVREDMEPTYVYLKKFSRRWVHVHGDWHDRMQWFGTLFDGAFGIRRRMPLAHENIERRGYGHSELLEADHLAGVLLRK